MPQTLIEKIVQKHAVGLEPGHIVQSGDFISIQPAHVMTHDNTGAVMSKFKTIGAKKMANPRQPVFTLDHNVQDKSKSNLAKYSKIRDFAQKHSYRDWCIVLFDLCCGKGVLSCLMACVIPKIIS